MNDIFEKYKYLLDYPEFDDALILSRYLLRIGESKGSGEPIFSDPTFIFSTNIAFKYVVLMYAPDSELSSISDINVRKTKAIKEAGVPLENMGSIINNQNPMISDMITRLFRIIDGFDYELLESAREAVAILLDVVRTPISKELEDDKARNAVKAKRECFEDASFMITEIKKLQKELADKGSDVAENVTKSAFKAGVAETLINRPRKS